MQRNRENNRVQKMRDPFKKIGDSEGRFHAKMGMIRDRDSKDGTKAKEINKMWQEYWSGLPLPSPGDPPNPGIEPGSPALQRDALQSEPPRKPII